MASCCLHCMSKGLLVARKVTNCKVLQQLSLLPRAVTSNGSPQSSLRFLYKTRRFHWFYNSVYVRNVCHARSQLMDEGSSAEGSGKQSLTGKMESGTRLSRLIVSVRDALVQKLAEAQKNVPMKLFSLLLGYYSANALSTLVGQTGDWDVFVIGLTVAFMEAISFLAYRLPALLSKFEEFFNMLNYWKIGLSLGFVLDKFKLDSGFLSF